MVPSRRKKNNKEAKKDARSQRDCMLGAFFDIQNIGVILSYGEGSLTNVRTGSRQRFFGQGLRMTAMVSQTFLLSLRGAEATRQSEIWFLTFRERERVKWNQDGELSN
jgi:hypothetical protein